jgi:hypothetical protein
VNFVCVSRGVRGPDVALDACGSGCVKYANGALRLPVPFVCSAGEFDVRGSRFAALLGCSRARNRAIWASLRFFSATRASFSFLVSMSLRRSVKMASGVSFESWEGGWRF